VAYDGKEIGDVQFKDLRRRDNGDYVLRVWEGKGDKYRETPVPSSLAIRIQTVEETSDVDSSDEVIDHSMRTCIRHVKLLLIGFKMRLEMKVQYLTKHPRLAVSAA